MQKVCAISSCNTATLQHLHHERRLDSGAGAFRVICGFVDDEISQRARERVAEVRKGRGYGEVRIIIEHNRPRWVRAVTYEQDRSQVRYDSIPQIMAALRNLVIILMRTAGETNIAAAGRRFAAQPWAASRSSAYRRELNDPDVLGCADGLES